MTIQIKHPFVSAKGDGGDATLVRPSNWNAVHSTSMATGNLIGRLTAGAGAFEEIPISAYMAGLLASADAAALAGVLGLFETGDVKYTFRTAASAGWLLMNTTSRSIGNAASSANLRANADTLNLFTLLYNGLSDSVAPVSGGRGASAAADFAANKTITIPALTGRSPIAAGVFAGLTTRVPGALYGEETHVLTQFEMPAHFHGAGIFDPGHSHSVTVNGVLVGPSIIVGGGGSFFGPNNTTVVSAAAATGVRITSGNGLDTTDTRGSGGAHNVVHPVIGLYAMVKL